MLTKKNNPTIFLPRDKPTAAWWRAPLREYLRERRRAAESNLMRPRPEWSVGFRALIDPLASDEAPSGTLYWQWSPHIIGAPNPESDEHTFTLAERMKLAERRELFARYVEAMILRADPNPHLADQLRPPHPPALRPDLVAPQLKREAEQRAILDNLDEKLRRRILAAGHLVWMAYFSWQWDDARLAHDGSCALSDLNPHTKTDRIRDDSDQESRAKGVAALLIGGMRNLYGEDRRSSVQALTEAVTGVQVTMKELIRLAGIRPSETCP